MELIIALFIEKGYKNVDINLGCPFPLLAKRHNGSGMLPLSRRGTGVADCCHKESPRPSVLCQDEVGLGEPEESLALLPLLNELPLTHIIMHPRLGKTAI